MGIDTKWLAKHLEEHEARMSDLNPYEESLALDLAKAQARIEDLIAERDEAWKRAGHSEKMWGEAEAKLAACEKYRDAYAECDRIGTQAVRDLEAKLAKALTALGDVQWFVKDLEPYADQGHTLVPALQKACAVYVELTGGKDE